MPDDINVGDRYHRLAHPEHVFLVARVTEFHHYTTQVMLVAENSVSGCLILEFTVRALVAPKRAPQLFDNNRFIVSRLCGDRPGMAS